MYPAYRTYIGSKPIYIISWAATFDFQQCGILTSVDSDEPVQPSFKLTNSKRCSVSSLTLIEYSSDYSKVSDQTVHMRRLIWGFAGPTYHIVGNLMSRLKLIIFFRGIGRKVERSLTWLILGMPVCPWFGLARRRKQVVERERDSSACIRYRCWKWYLEMLLVRIGFCTTKSDIRQYWFLACFLSHAQMFKLTKHSFLNSNRIWSGSELWQRFFFIFFKGERIQRSLKAGHHWPNQRNAIFHWRADDGPTLNAGLVVLRISGDPVQYC